MGNGDWISKVEGIRHPPKASRTVSDRKPENEVLLEGSTYSILKRVWGSSSVSHYPPHHY